MTNSDILYDMITNLIVGIGFSIAFLRMFRDNLRISLIRASVTMILVSLVSSAAGDMMLIAGIKENYEIWAYVFDLIFYVPVVLLIKHNWINCQIQVQVFVTMYNLIGVALILMGTMICGAVAGDAGWYVRSEGTAAMKAVEIGALILSVLLGFIITSRLSGTILSLTGISRAVLAIMILIEFVTGIIIKPLVVDMLAYRNSSEGAGLAFDTVSMGLSTIAIIVILWLHIRAIKQQKRRVQESIEKSAGDYSQVAELKEEIRELNHEMVNFSHIDKKGDE